MSTVDDDEMSRFAKLAEEWWNPYGPLRPLHLLNPTRLRYIRDIVCRHYHRPSDIRKSLSHLRILDVGCGGGLVSESLVRMGAEVVGIDTEERTLRIAKVHAHTMNLSIDYRIMSAEVLSQTEERFDVVLGLEVIEHVADVALFLNALSRLLKEQGILVIATLNRSVKAFLFAILGAEYVLRWLPKGTHNWYRFLKPSEVLMGLKRNGCVVIDVMGVGYRSRGFRLDPYDISVNYMVAATKIRQ